MRYHQLSESKVNIQDEERVELIRFMIEWINGTYMTGGTKDPVVMWERINSLFPSGISTPKKLMRLVTLPIEYADQQFFHLERPAPKFVSSWTSTHFGLESVHGVANEIVSGADTCRIAIKALISPENILASHQSVKRAFLSLTRDYYYSDYEVTNKIPNDEGGITYTTTYKPYLGVDDSLFHDDLSYYQSLFRDMLGGPLRQYEYIVRTTPLDVQNIKVYRRGNEYLHDGHDDPHNSGGYRGWSY